MEQIIRDYFASWITKDPSVIKQHFADQCSYTECYGPVYRNKQECLRWFTEWNRLGSVVIWDIRKITVFKETCFVEWFFKCDYQGSPGEFDGISIIEFAENRIASVREFQSKAEHTHPYGNQP